MTPNTLLLLRALQAEPGRELYGFEVIRAAGLPSGTVSVVEPEPDDAPTPKNCKHRNLRMAKGVCPDCSTYVTSKGAGK